MIVERSVVVAALKLVQVDIEPAVSRDQPPAAKIWLFAIAVVNNEVWFSHAATAFLFAMFARTSAATIGGQTEFPQRATWAVLVKVFPWPSCSMT